MKIKKLKKFLCIILQQRRRFWPWCSVVYFLNSNKRRVFSKLESYLFIRCWNSILLSTSHRSVHITTFIQHEHKWAQDCQEKLWHGIHEWITKPWMVSEWMSVLIGTSTMVIQFFLCCLLNSLLGTNSLTPVVALVDRTACTTSKFAATEI